MARILFKRKATDDEGNITDNTVDYLSLASPMTNEDESDDIKNHNNSTIKERYIQTELSGVYKKGVKVFDMSSLSPLQEKAVDELCFVAETFSSPVNG